MATQLFFRNAVSDISTGVSSVLAGTNSTFTPRLLSTTRGATAVSQDVDTVAGPTNGQEVAISTTTFASNGPREWLSAPLAAGVTISGSITWNLRASENNMSANVAINGILEVINGATGAITLINKTTRVVELAVLTQTAENFAQTPVAGVACNKGDRLRVRIFGDDVGTMASGFAFTFWWDGPTAAASGDSYLTLTETLTFASEPAGSQVFPTATASAVATASVDRDAWTSRGAGVQNDATNTVVGPTTGVQTTDTAGGTVVDWFTRSLTAFTLAGAVRCNIRIDSAGQALGVGVEIALVANDGSGPTVWGKVVSGLAPIPEGAMSFLVSGADLAVTAGQRLRLRLYLKDAADPGSSTNLMGSGAIAKTYYAGTVSGASGDTFLTFTQTLTESVAAALPISCFARQAVKAASLR